MSDNTNATPFDPRRYVGAGFLTVALLVVGLGGWAAFSHISGAVVAAGQIEVEGNRQVVQHPAGGVIEAIEARDGDRVAAGDVLLVLDGDALRTELAIVEGQLFEIVARKNRLAAERDGASDVVFDGELIERAERIADIADLIASQVLQFETRRGALEEESQQLRERLTQIGRQIDGLHSQRNATAEQVALTSAEITSQEALYAQGLTQQVRLLTPQRERARLQGIEGQIDAAIAENRAKIAEIEIEILRLTTRLREEAITALRELEFREIELRERRSRLREDINRLEIRAPVAGIVYGSTADTLRAVIRPAEPILHIVPQDAPLIVRARIEAIHIDQVRAGQTAVLHFSAFDARSTPELEGEVADVSADVFVDDRSGMAYYRADIRLDSDAGETLGGKSLLPGMPVEAFIRTEDRTPLAYLVKPVAVYFNRAFRER
ncbi:HlyD family type I secretion periplasmic adaptor subunit [soil metagenome]